MLIRKVVMENYGLYRGRNEFDLAPRMKYNKMRPIILFGGKNGAGKTTLLDAVRLALYGKTSLGTKVRQSDYNEFLRARIHRVHNGILSPTFASIGIEFEHSLGGEPETYWIERSWELHNGNGVHENLLVERNGQALNDIRVDYWQEFVKDLIPEGLSQLFFFDGEKIKNLAEDATGNEELAESIKALLGLDIAERLKADLSTYSARLINKTQTGKDVERLSEVEERLGEIHHQITAKTEDRASVVTKIDGCRSEISNIEKRLKREGKDYADNREQLAASRADLFSNIESIKKRVREECEGPFAFSLCPTISGLLKKQLKTEEVLTEHLLIQNEMKETKQELMDIVSKRRTSLKKLQEEVVSEIVRDISAVMDARIAPLTGLASHQVVFGVSSTESGKLIEWTSGSAGFARKKMTDLCNELENLTRRLQVVEQDLGRAPQQDVLKPLVEEVNAWNQKLGQAQTVLGVVDAELKSLENEKAALDREMVRLIDAAKDIDNHNTKLLLSKKVREAMDVYLERLTARKIGELEESVAGCFNNLLRKGDILRRIAIDPKTFGVALYDKDGLAIPKEELSSGEKQIYAISVLWALAKTSGRPLPMIVDTPLARLDSDHRKNLLENYFPNAAHQVVILSTDTEVDREHFQNLSKNVSHAYRLDFDPVERCTIPKEGYFWRDQANA